MTEGLGNWPSIEGRFKIGNKLSPVAVCTNATVEGIELDMEKVAIIGKCVTENLGIEKIIQNIVSNPNIRFLILCGKDSKGHFVSQAITSLIKNGIDKEKKIIGAMGNTPFLKGIDEDLIGRFRQQVKTINLIGETDSKKIMEAVEDCGKKKPGPFSGETIKVEKVEEIEAKFSPDWIADPKGFFVISVDRDRKKIIAEHYQQNKLKMKISGDSAEGISKTITKLNLIGNFKQDKVHAMYLGRELQKAEVALKNILDYEQDGELRVKFAENNVEFSKETENLPEQNDWFD